MKFERYRSFYLLEVIMEFFERLLDPYLWFALGFAMFGNGILGLVVRSATHNIDILFMRRLVRNMFIVVMFYLLFTAYQPSPEFDPQSLLPPEGTDWFNVGIKILAAYLGAWALLSGLEKHAHNLFMFFDSSFYTEIKKPMKKKPIAKK